MDTGQLDLRRSFAIFGFYPGIRDAAGRGRWGPIMELLTAQLAQTDFGLLAIACRQGNLDFISWAHDHPHLYPLQQSLPNAAVAAAVEHGQAHILEWICDHLPQQQFRAISALCFASPAQQGDLQTLQLGFRLAQVREGDEIWISCLLDAIKASDVKPADLLYCATFQAQHLEVISWLGSHLQAAFEEVCDTYFSAQPASSMLYPKLSRADSIKVDRIIAACNDSMVPVQLAAKQMQPRIPWAISNIRAAYRHGDKQVSPASHAPPVFRR